MAKKLFISGASGLVGGNCLRYFREKGWEVVGSHRTYPTRGTVYYDTLQPEDPKNFDLFQFAPEVIIHCGALTHVDYCEEHPDESYLKNVTTTKHLFQLALKLKAKFVFISTDYVFDGKQGPYTEEAATNPLNVYGKHKLETEDFIREHTEDYLIIRATNIYGTEERKKNFIARIVKQCLSGEEVHLKLPYDQFAGPLNALDLAKALALLIENHKRGLYHLCSTDYMNRVSLAKKVLSYFPDIKGQIETCSTQTLGQAAKRPLLGGVLAQKFVSEFPDFSFSSVDDYLKQVGPKNPFSDSKPSY